MKTLTIATALTFIAAGQALAASAPSFSPGATPQTARNVVAAYNIDQTKVAEGVKFQNPGKAKGVSQQPGKMIFKALPTRG